MRGKPSHRDQRPNRTCCTQIKKSALLQPFYENRYVSQTCPCPGHIELKLITVLWSNCWLNGLKALFSKCSRVPLIAHKWLWLVTGYWWKVELSVSIFLITDWMLTLEWESHFRWQSFPLTMMSHRHTGSRRERDGLITKVLVQRCQFRNSLFRHPLYNPKGTNLENAYDHEHHVMLTNNEANMVDPSLP